MVHALVMLDKVTAPEGRSPEWQTALNNALLESSYVHARALFEFFEKPEAHENTQRQITDLSRVWTLLAG
jgi:hypothetical protein